MRQVIATLAMTVVVFTLALLLGSVLRELLPLLMSRQASLGFAAQAVGLLIPFVSAFALPIGVLTATLLVFGRFSADQELTAARASGVSLLSLVLPILALSLLLCGVSALVNLDVGPRSRVQFKDLTNRLKVELLSNLQLPEGRPIYDFTNYVVFIGKNRNRELQDVHLLQLRNETNVEVTLDAPRGRIEVNLTNQSIMLHLFDARIMRLDNGLVAVAGETQTQLDWRGATNKQERVSISNMTFRQLREELRTWEQRIHEPVYGSEDSAQDLRKRNQQLQKKRDDLIEPIRVQMNRQLASSFACFSFALIGIPLGIRVHRRETNVGFGIALALVWVYYALMSFAGSLENRPELAPHILIWIPGFLFQAIGAVLLWRANRGI
ncbi:MAG: LptF/LptG family permease [Verrucomicrobiota bacterium]